MFSTNESAKLESITLGLEIIFKLPWRSMSEIAFSNFELLSPLIKINAINNPH
jgi:hypothetical protein